ncbi:MAG TPA: HD domain-containing phosphohydrolase [Clostridia bacterium]|nr:HD domain-containing phosphohydrolase [Clostridia bacterium]
MSIRSKILHAIIPLVLLSVILSNLAFWFFTKSYIGQQESQQVKVASESVSSYFKHRFENDIGTVNDWAHWDDTYHFLNGSNPNYIELNLNESTFENLDSSFFILVDQSGQIVYSRYCDLNTVSLTSFPAAFESALPDLIDYASLNHDVSFLKQIGDDFYFFASSEVVDSISIKPADGRLIIGRILDADMIQNLEAVSGAKLASITSVQASEENPQTNSIYNSNASVQKTKDGIEILLYMPDPYRTTEAVRFQLVLSREIYLTSMRQLLSFTIINILVITICATVLIIIWGNRIIKPFLGLVHEVGRIDTESGNYKRVSDFQGKEVTLLANSINHLLGRIETAQQELSDSKKKLEATLTSVGDGVFAVDVDLNIVFMNPVAQKLTGWTFEEACGKPVGNVFRIINEYTREEVPSPIQKVFLVREIVELANHTMLIAKDGTEIPIEDTAAPIFDESGEITGCVLVFRDSSERKERQKRIEYLSYHDQLTDLYNRRFFEEELRRLDVERNLPLSIIYADVNGLKVINDAFGHECGDMLLVEVADAMKAACRADDIIARIGGDEFVILLPSTDPAFAESIIQRIKERIGTVYINGMSASVSLGLETKTDSAQSTNDIMNRAEQGMYQEKIQDAGGYRSVVIREVFDALIHKVPWAKEHASRVRQLCELLGQALGMSASDLIEIRIAAELHDIGNVSLDADLLNKPCALNDKEWVQIKKHPETGYRLLGTCSEYYNIADIVLAHHERIDGTGYPMQLKGDEINWKARVLAVAEAFDTMVHPQPYRAALSREEAVSELVRNKGTQFDADIVDAFVAGVAGKLPESF